MFRSALFGLTALLVIASCAAPALSEVVYVEPLTVGADLVTGVEGQPPRCDVRAFVQEGLVEVGCTVVDEIGSMSPEVMVNMVYEQIGDGGWLTVRSFDIVVGRQFSERRYYLVAEAENCFAEAAKMVRQVAFPPFYENNKSLLFDNSSGIEFVLVPSGTVKVNGVNREVAGFFLARFETTQAQWEKVMGYNPSVFRGEPSRPVDNVSWLEVQEYLEKLQHRGRKDYRLPTELEWEYAARTRGRNIGFAGTDKEAELNDFAWTSANAQRGSHPVGGKTANGLGLYDMSGNVSEWCSDTFFEGGFNGGGSIGDAHEKAIRGGSWMLGADYALVRKRDAAAAASRSGDNGFRVVLPILNR